MRTYLTQFALILAGWMAINATLPFRAEREGSLLFNSEIAHFYRTGERAAPGLLFDAQLVMPADSAATAYKVMLFSYSEWDSVYSVQMRQFLSRELPGATIVGSEEDTDGFSERSLEGQQAVVVTYPSVGDPTMLKEYGQKLERFARKGGLVIISGTHKYEVINALGLLDVEYASFVEEAAMHVKSESHPILAGLNSDFTLQNNIYPLEISDASFVTLMDYQGLPVVGYKNIGAGKIVYLGLEYYFDEAAPSRLLGNVFKWALADQTPTTPSNTSVSAAQQIFSRTTTKKTEEILYAGSHPVIELKIFPNPYFEKASLEFTLDKTMTVSAEMTSETGGISAVLLPQRTLSAGYYRLEIPDLAPGIYFVKCKIGNQVEVRKVVKARVGSAR
jgi:hypothetical protein